MNDIKNKLIDDVSEYVTKSTYGFPESEKLLNNILIRTSTLKTVEECFICENNSLSLSVDKNRCLSDNQCQELLNKLKSPC